MENSIGNGQSAMGFVQRNASQRGRSPIRLEKSVGTYLSGTGIDTIIIFYVYKL
jgi:hypothetical protein